MILKFMFQFYMIQEIVEQRHTALASVGQPSYNQLLCSILAV